MAPRSDDRLAHVPQLDGVRALAFLAVFAHHAFGAQPLWMGVDLFFALSGFLITRNLLALRAAATTPQALRTFFVRRVLRIVPPYYLALTIIVIAAPIAARELPWFYGFASNIRDTLHGPIPGALNTFWSIAVEEQFYLVWPFLVLLAPRRWLGAAFAAAIVAAIAARAIASASATIGVEASFRLAPCRMDLLAAGALLAIAEARDAAWFARHRARFAAVAAIAMLGFATLALYQPSFRPGVDNRTFEIAGLALSAVTWTMAIAYLRAPGGWLAGALRHPALRALGRVSYMAYLVHAFALVLVGRAELDDASTAALALALTLALATASWFGVERPIARWRDRHDRRDRGAITPR